jgi:hypothetical protein
MREKVKFKKRNLLKVIRKTITVIIIMIKCKDKKKNKKRGNQVIVMRVAKKRRKKDFKAAHVPTLKRLEKR